MKSIAHTKFALLLIAAFAGLTYTAWSQSESHESAAASTLSKLAEPATTTLYDVAFTGDYYVAVGRWGTILTSVDGTAWRQQDSDTDANLRSIAAGAAAGGAVGKEGTVTVSPDGIRNWQRQNSGTSAGPSIAICSRPLQSQPIRRSFEGKSKMSISSSVSL